MNSGKVLVLNAKNYDGTNETFCHTNQQKRSTVDCILLVNSVNMDKLVDLRRPLEKLAFKTMAAQTKNV